MLIKKEHGRFTQNLWAIPGEFQHAIVIADIDKWKKIKKGRMVVKKMFAERQNISLLRDLKIRKLFE